LRPCAFLLAGRLAVMAPKREVEACWFQQNEANLSEADRLIASNVADRKRLTDTTGLTVAVVDEVFAMLKGAAEGSENHSVLLLGEAGSGKTHVVETCVRKLIEAKPSTVVLRARGSAYSTDVECLRHLAMQITDRLVEVPHANASFEIGMEWMRKVFRGSFKHDTAVVLVLDQFEHFCSRVRQTLLYNLFNLAEEAGVRLSVIGTSVRVDVMDSLEKRIRSRFSMRHLHTFVPTCMKDLVEVLMSRLKLPSNCGLKAPFLKELHTRMDKALFAKRAEWQQHVELGQPPSWFLARCLPVTALLRSVEAGDTCVPVTPPAKRNRSAPMTPGCLPSATGRETTSLLVEQLSEQEHCVLIALLRLHERKISQSLAAVLHEIGLLHDDSKDLTSKFKEDSYCFAFDRLAQQKLVELKVHNPTDLPRRYLPCHSSVNDVYARYAHTLSSEPSALTNPLSRLPTAIQKWASQRQMSASKPN